MKKLFAIGLSLAMMTTICGCHSLERSIVAINAVGNSETFVELETDELISLIDSKQHFLLETYSPYCSHCQNLEPLLKKYSSEKHKTIYRMDLTQVATEAEFNEKLGSKYPDIFPNSNVPSLSFISEAKLTYQVSSNKFDSYTALSTILDKVWITSKIVLVNDEAQFTEFKNNNQTYIAYSYDLKNQQSLKIAAESLVTKEAAKKKTSILLLNYQEMQANFDSVKSYYGAGETYFIAVVKNGEVSNTYDYTVTSFDINSVLNSI